MSRIVPVVLCGGIGARLWPMSRSQSPKQFHPVADAGSLTFFQSTVQRHRAGCYADPVVVTATPHVQTVLRQLAGLQCDGRLIVEPFARNTGPAVLAAALEIAAEDPDRLMLVLPSDHVISGDFDSIAADARKAAEDGRIVLFGITPAYPETGYGYIVDGGIFRHNAALRRVAKFVEKPPREQAEALITSGSAYWASGISLFAARTIIDEFRRIDPKTFAAVSLAFENGIRKAGQVHLGGEAFRHARAEPTERIIFEHSPHVILAPADITWSDVGSWTSVHGVGQQDEKGNVFHGDVIATDTENALVRAGDRLVALVGVPEVIVIDTPDALLVTRRGRCQDVQKVVELLRRSQRLEASRHKRREHEWGRSMSLLRSGGLDMVMLTINSGTSVNIDPEPGRKLIVTRGTIEMFDGPWRRSVGQGEHVTLDNLQPCRLVNAGAQEAEALLMTLRPTLMLAAQAGVSHHVS
ncbi:hypothetical protein LCM08_25325 [Salipiger pacificus]|nr:hypothetical protein [Alloyangia pacifica]MCA0948262.1 hypothetical protein [Alloyangia pacifica]